MNCIVYFVILAVFAGSNSAANLTYTTSLDDYTAASERNNRNDIQAADKRIECFDERAKDILRILKDQQEETVKEIIRFQESLIPVEALSLIRKHCVQKYKVLLATKVETESKFVACYTAAEKRVNTITAAAKSSVAAAKLMVNTDLPLLLISCNKTNFANPPKKEECVVNNINKYTSDIQTKIRDVEKNLDASLCTSTDLSRDAIQCSFVVERTVLITIGKVQSLIDTCMQETATVCPCAKSLMVESDTPNVSRLLTSGAIKNTTST